MRVFIQFDYFSPSFLNHSLLTKEDSFHSKWGEVVVITVLGTYMVLFIFKTLLQTLINAETVVTSLGGWKES